MEEKIDKAIEFLAEEITKQPATNSPLSYSESILNLVRTKEILFNIGVTKENSEKNAPLVGAYLTDEPWVEFATIRDAVDYDNPTGDLHEELHIECRMSDGRKGAFIVVSSDFPELAESICAFLNRKVKRAATP